MRASSFIYAVAAGLSLGCNRPVSEIGPVALPPAKTHDTGDAPPSFELAAVEGVEVDDGFGAALIAEGEIVWIGAPHGEQGRVYAWNDSILTLAIERAGRAGAHLASTPSGPWFSAPLADPLAGQVIRPDGTSVDTVEPNAGIALSY